MQHGSFDGLVRPISEMDKILTHASILLLDARRVLYQHFLELAGRSNARPPGTRSVSA
ncbi:hypothetical protein OIHEL45_16376 [Sulfitobacter indolifex HEL-45]|uniref:Uncharacterized protein n=1 Tax=Sulfitobacter indolifex HEL-45 TaxID=391624 RepID=A0ABP2D5K1_9RHOB|nr:hypothetical protein OIHEL45_16376 [Sulfitobacter indolifex HEL-45]